MYVEQGENYRVYGDFLLLRTDPYGFWCVKTTDNKGVAAIPDAFTTVRAAVNAIDVYLKNQAASPKKKR